MPRRRTPVEEYEGAKEGETDERRGDRPHEALGACVGGVARQGAAAKEPHQRQHHCYPTGRAEGPTGGAAALGAPQNGVEADPREHGEAEGRWNEGPVPGRATDRGQLGEQPVHGMQDAGREHHRRCGGESDDRRLTPTESDGHDREHQGDRSDPHPCRGEVPLDIDEAARERLTPEALEDEPERLGDRPRVALGRGVPDRFGGQLEPGKCERGGENPSGDEGEGEIDDRTANEPVATEDSRAAKEEDDNEGAEGEEYEDFDLWVAGQDGERKRHGQEHYGPVPTGAAHDEESGGKLPAGPGHHRRVRKPEITEERSAQHPCRPGERAGDRVQAEHPPEEVRPRPPDDQRDEDLDPVDQPKRREITDQGRQAEGPGPEVKRQRHPQCLVVGPEGQMAVVDLGPGQGDPRGELGVLVADRAVVHDRSGLLQQSGGMYEVERPEVGTAVRAGTSATHAAATTQRMPTMSGQRRRSREATVALVSPIRPPGCLRFRQWVIDLQPHDGGSIMGVIQPVHEPVHSSQRSGGTDSLRGGAVSTSSMPWER